MIDSSDTDIVERLRNNFCPENMGCNAHKYCACSDMDDAADEIERLRDDLTEYINTSTEQQTEIERLRAEVAIWRDYCPEMVDVVEKAVNAT